MSLHSQLRTLLLSLDEVTALVGSGDAARVRCEAFEKRDGLVGRPAILVEVDRQERQNDIEGRGGLVIGDVTMTFRAATRAVADQLAEAARVNGTDPGTGLAGYESATLDLVWEDDVTAWVPKSDGSEDGVYDVVASLTAIRPEVA